VKPTPPASFADFDDEYVVATVANASDSRFPTTNAGTRSASSTFSRFGTFFLPFAAAAAFAAPMPEQRTCRLITFARRSQSRLVDVMWALDDWTLTEEAATVEQIRMLNELLALSATEGSALDHSE
jgi:hypothetical protein